MLMFSLAPADPFAQALADALGVTLSPHEERLFPDGEHKLRPLVGPRGADAYVVHSLHGGPIDSPHDKLCRLLMFIATLKDHGAARVTAVVPYLVEHMTVGLGGDGKTVGHTHALGRQFADHLAERRVLAAD